jgi:hypothetical protein
MRAVAASLVGDGQQDELAMANFLDFTGHDIELGRIYLIVGRIEAITQVLMVLSFDEGS